MMTHLTEETILAVRDREQVADEVLTHVEECAFCARVLEEARTRAQGGREGAGGAGAARAGDGGGTTAGGRSQAGCGPGCADRSRAAGCSEGSPSPGRRPYLVVAR